MEASSGIEPEYADLQSAASPLRHEAMTIYVVIYMQIYMPIQFDVNKVHETVITCAHVL